MVTPSSLITRRVDSHDVVLRRPLTAVAALVRFADDPKLLAVEWEDGAPPCQFVTPARDAVLTALLSAAQAASGRPIAVMPGMLPTSPALLTCSVGILACFGTPCSAASISPVSFELTSTW